MALTEIISETTAAATVSDVALAAQTTLVAGGFSEASLTHDERIIVNIKRLNGDYEAVAPPIILHKGQNTGVIQATGTYQFVKSTTASAVDLGYEL